MCAKIHCIVRHWSLLSGRVVLALVAAGTAWRFATLGWQSLWLDEAYSVWLATHHSAGAIWSARIDPLHPPGYYWLLHWVLRALGNSDTTARLLSAAASCASVAIVYAIGRRVWPSSGTGAVAAVLLALAPLDVWYAQEARMYSLVAAMGSVLALGLFSTARWGCLLVFLGLAGGVAADHTMWPVAAVLGGVWCVWWWTTGRRKVLVAGVGVATAAALFLSRALWDEAVQVYARLDAVAVFRNLRQAFGIDSVTLLPLPVALAATAVIGAAAAWGLARLRKNPRRGAWLAASALGVLVAAATLAATPRLYGAKQILASVWPLVTLVAAAAMTGVSGSTGRDGTSTGTRLAFVWLGVGASIAGLAATLAAPRADWRGAAAWIAHRPAAVALIDPAWNDVVYRHYRAGDDVIAGPVDTVDRLRAAGRGVREVCLVAERFGATPPTSPSEAWLDRELPLAGRARFSRLEVVCYAMPPPEAAWRR